MAYTEHCRISWVIYPDGEGRPNRIYCELLDRSLVHEKSIAYSFFALPPDTSWQEAENIKKVLEQLETISVKHFAPGEGV